MEWVEVVDYGVRKKFREAMSRDITSLMRNRIVYEFLN